MSDIMNIRIVLLLLLLIASPLKAESLRIITESFPPYNFQVDDEAKGLSSEVVQAVLNQINLQASIELYPGSRAYETALTEKNILIYSIARIAEREALFHWVGAIAPYKTSLFKLKSNKSIQVNSRGRRHSQVNFVWQTAPRMGQWLQARAWNTPPNSHT